MDNIVVNTIVRMFTRKAVGKAMKSANKDKQGGSHKGGPKRRRGAAMNEKIIDRGTVGPRNRRQERDG